MRWRFYDRANQDEVAEHHEIERRIDSWWREFSRQSERLSQVFRRGAEMDIPAWMNDHLQSIDSHLMWEFGPAVRGEGPRLVMTPESHTELRPLVDELIARGPQISGWEFYTYRLPEPFDDLAANLQARTGYNLELPRVGLTIGQHNRIDLAFAWNELPDDEVLANYVNFVATEDLLGEELLDKWVGVIESVESSNGPAAGQRFLTLDRLNEMFHSLMASIQEQLPPLPFSNSDEDNWSLLELAPEQAEDYPLRSDLLTCLTCNLTMTQASFSSSFYSERFAKNGETFCYLKIDGSELEENPQFADREELEQGCGRLWRREI